MAEFKMPSLGADMETGTLAEWLIEPGDKVQRGDVVAVVETQKGAIEVEIFQAGEVEKILVTVGERVPVGTVLALIRVEGEAEAAKTQATPRVKTVEAPELKAPAQQQLAAQPARLASQRPRISPVARKRAAELGVDLEGLSGTGPNGVITLDDVERTTRHARPVTPAEHRAAMRRAIATAMARSKREIPHYYLGTSINMDRAMAWLKAENERRPVTERLVYAIVLVKAVALALHQVPELNGFWIDGSFRPSQDIHSGMAISLRGGGLVAPALHNADNRSLDDLMNGFRDLVQRARTASLRSSEMSDATITVTNLGERGVDRVFGIIYPPQVALVGFGRLLERPWSKNGEIQSSLVIEATLAGDHRVSDGHRGGLFLAAIDRLLQEPEKL